MIRFVQVDSSKCLGCRSCEIACGLIHQELDLFGSALHGHIQFSINLFIRINLLKYGSFITLLIKKLMLFAK
ncbi:hypothetical protein HA075_23530 [bacterium BFN5]|nr:hypothetical protein HA075_23530 [bacterium BFN5]